MHNPEMNQNSIKERIISGSNEEKIVYIGMVCNNFDFTFSSVTSNIEPLGKAKAFLKAFFSSLVLPMKGQQTLSTTSSTEQMLCSVQHHQKENERQRWNPFLSMHLSCSVACGSCQFSSISRCGLPAADLSLPHIQELRFQSLVFYSTPHHLALFYEIRKD